MTTPNRIQTERLILRRYQLTDAGEIFACYAQDGTVTKYLTWKPHQSIEETQEFIEGRIHAWDKGDDFTWAVTTIDGHLIGAISLRIDGFKADFGYVIGRQFWGNGYATEALQAIIQWGFEHPQIFRVWAVCDVENTASARVMEKCGLEREGVLKRWIIHPQISDTPRDCFCYSITREMASQQSHTVDADNPRR